VSFDYLDTRVIAAAGVLVAVVATAGSLFLSLALGLVPCELCWYQRITMYPLVVVFGVALWERRPGADRPGVSHRTVARIVAPLAGVGTVVAAYHSWLQITSTGGTCTVGGGCAAVQLRVVGLSIPNLSLVAHLLVGLAALALWRTAEIDR
jgi:disulfide bond formation protein DsbB